MRQFSNFKRNNLIPLLDAGNDFTEENKQLQHPRHQPQGNWEYSTSRKPFQLLSVGNGYGRNLWPSRQNCFLGETDYDVAQAWLQMGQTDCNKQKYYPTSRTVRADVNLEAGAESGTPNKSLSWWRPSKLQNSLENWRGDQLGDMNHMGCQNSRPNLWEGSRATTTRGAINRNGASAVQSQGGLPKCARTRASTSSTDGSGSTRSTMANKGSKFAHSTGCPSSTANDCVNAPEQISWPLSLVGTWNQSFALNTTPTPTRLKPKDENICRRKMSSGASHWKSAVDPRTGRTYYYHELTRETQWRKPMELASSDEKRAMEDKERKQKDFFAAMEANILASMSQGVVPGTPKQPAVGRQRSKQPPTTQRGPRPELVRTISSMDETALKDIIMRQPSFRNVTKKHSLTPGDLEKSNHEGEGDFSSFSHMPLDPLAESAREFDNFGNDSVDDLFDDLPDEDPGGDDSDEGSVEIGGDTPIGLKSAKSTRSDGGKLNESSISGFGLTWEETRALKNLAKITKEMVDAENDDNIDMSGLKLGANKGAKSAPGTPFLGKADNKGQRELPRELDFDDDSESSRGQADSNTPPKGKGARALPRELEFDDSDSETESAPPPKSKVSVVRIAEDAKKSSNDKKKKENPILPLTRRNTCGTLYVGTTMSAPDKDATIKCVCGVFRAHILSSESLRPSGNDEYKVFNDHVSQQGQGGFSESNALPPFHVVPTLEEVTRFYRDIFFKAQMESDCIIMSLIYVERLIKRTNGGVRPRASNWRSLIFSCMILSSKVWDDLSMWNADFSQSCPPGVSFPLKRINQLELAVLNALTFQVKVPASEYAKYYFLLRSMLIKSGLGGEEMRSMNPLDVQGARRMQEVSSQFENVSLNRSSVTKELTNRSKSLGVAESRNIHARMDAGNKVSLEEVVKM